MKIYLADLGHNILTYSSDTYPLGVGNVATWLRSHVDGAEDYDIRIYREPQDLKAAIDDTAPDILGLSNYAWNHELASHFARYLRQRSPQALIAMGGPNWPLTEPVQEQFLRETSDVDVYIDGPTYEGERAFQFLVERFQAGGRRREAVFEGSLAGNAWLDPKSGELVKGEKVDRILDLDEIPSPYLAGLMEPFFETGYFPLMQIARGCPFSCAFCNSGVQGNSRVLAHSIENVKTDLEYIAKRVRPETALCLADDNFGMYERDEEVADYFAFLQDQYGWPRYVRTTTGKNRGERIIRVMRKSRGILPMTAAVQSLNKTVLTNIKRSNIKLDTYRELQEEIRRMGMQSYGELILCLPGETKQSFMKGIEDLLDSGVQRVSAHQLMLLHGAELANPGTRERFGFETRWRVVARNIGDYTGEPVIEVEEMVIATPEFSFEDYLDARIFHLLLTTFYYEGNLEEAFRLALANGVKAFDLVTRLQQMLPEAPAGFRQVIDDFVRESTEELFETKEACLEWAHGNYDGLIEGTLGGNLLSKYSMIGRFFATQSGLDFVEAGLASATAEADSPVDSEELSAVMSYLRSAVLHVPFAETMAANPTWTTNYDVESWAAEDYDRPLARYRRPASRSFTGFVSAERRRLIQSKIDTFGEHAAGLGKFTRTMFARDLRRTFQPCTETSAQNVA